MAHLRQFVYRLVGRLRGYPNDDRDQAARIGRHYRINLRPGARVDAAKLLGRLAAERYAAARAKTAATIISAAHAGRSAARTAVRVLVDPVGADQPSRRPHPPTSRHRLTDDTAPFHGIAADLVAASRALAAGPRVAGERPWWQRARGSAA